MQDGGCSSVLLIQTVQYNDWISHQQSGKRPTDSMQSGWVQARLAHRVPRMVSEVQGLYNFNPKKFNTDEHPYGTTRKFFCSI